MATSKSTRRKAKQLPVTQHSELLPSREALCDRLKDLEDRLYQVKSMYETAYLALDSENFDLLNDTVHLCNVIRAANVQLGELASGLDPVAVLRAEGAQS
jgi:hypothetical protein